MGWFKKVVHEVSKPFKEYIGAGSSLVGDVVNSTMTGLGLPTIGDFLTGQSATQIQTEAQQQLASDQYNYNKKLQDEAQRFNAAEAQKNRDWETAMSNSAYQRARADAEAAGYNPLIGLTGQASTPTSAVASSPGASVGQGQVSGQSKGIGDLMSLFGTLGNLVKLGTDIRKVQNSSAKDIAQASYYDELAKKTDLEAQSIDPEAKKNLDRHPGPLGQAWNTSTQISRDSANSAAEQLDTLKEFSKNFIIGDVSTWPKELRNPSGLRFDPSVGRYTK